MLFLSVFKAIINGGEYFRQSKQNDKFLIFFALNICQCQKVLGYLHKN